MLLLVRCPKRGAVGPASFIVPNAEHSAHDCPDGGSTCTDTDKLAAADVWLQTNIQPLLSSTTFQQDGVLVVVFDESDSSDSQNGGGHVAMVIVSPKAKSAFQSTTFYQHQSTFRLVLEALGLLHFLALPPMHQIWWSFPLNLKAIRTTRNAEVNNC